MLALSDRIDEREEKDRNSRVSQPSFLQKALATRNLHKDGSFDKTINSDRPIRYRGMNLGNFISDLNQWCELIHKNTE